MKSKTVYTIIRILIGLIFVAFGAMKFFPVPPESIPTGVPGEFLAGLAASGYFIPFLAICEVVIGLMLIFNLWAALASVMLVPISLNIFLFDVILQPSGWFVGVIPLAANIYFLYYHRDKYKQMLVK